MEAGKVPKIGAAGEKKEQKVPARGKKRSARPRAEGSRAVTHHEGLERGVELADPRPGTRGSGHDVLLRVAAVPDQLLELLDARLLDVRGLLQVLNLPIHGGAVGLGEARVLRLGDLLGGLGLLGVVGDGVGDRSVLDRVGLSLGIGGDGVHVDGGVVLGGGHLREKVVVDLVSGGGFVATQKRLVGERRKRAFTAACRCVLEDWCDGPWKDVRWVVPARRERRRSRGHLISRCCSGTLVTAITRIGTRWQTNSQPLLLLAPPLFPATCTAVLVRTKALRPGAA